jgi:hypothetical protein
MNKTETIKFLSDLFGEITYNCIVKNDKNKKEPKEWITVKGNHIPIYEGQTKEDAIQDFLENKQTGGYSERNKSNRSIAAELEGKSNISELAKKLGVKSSEINGVLYTDEWHHTNKNFKKTEYYYTDAFLDLKNNGEIKEDTIKKYDLSKYQISEIKKSWEAFINKSKNKTSTTDIIEEYQQKYKNDDNLYKMLEEEKTLKPSQYKNSYIGKGSIRRVIEQYRQGEYAKEDLDKLINFYSQEEREKHKNKH